MKKPVEKYKVTNIVKNIVNFSFDNYLFENKVRPKYFYISRLIYDNFSIEQKILDFG